MKKYTIGFSIIAVSLCMVVAQAQKPQPQKKKVAFKGKSYLHGGLIGSGKLSKKMFDSLIAYPLVTKDSNGNPHQAIQFMFSYSERGLYEDSTGKPQIMTDHYFTESVNGKLPEDWVPHIRAYSKGGDTVLFYDILSAYPDTLRTRFYTEPIKLVLTD